MTFSNSTTAMQREVPDSTRTSSHQQVRQIALTLFAEKGFQNVSLRKLASTLGVQPGSLYNHIASKHDLLFELIDEHETDLLDTIEADIPKNGTPQEKLFSYIRSHLSFNAQHPQHHSLTQLEFRNLNPSQQRAIQAIRIAHANVLKDIIQQGTQQKQFKPTSLRMGIVLILAMLNEAASTQHIEINASPENTTALLQEMILGMLSATP